MARAWLRVRLEWWSLCSKAGKRLRWQWLFWRGIDGMMCLRFEEEARDV